MRALLFTILICANAFAAPFFFGQQGVAFDADALDYFARIVGNSSTISDNNKTAVNTYVVGEKADGNWARLPFIGGFMGTDLSAAKVNLKPFSVSKTNSTLTSFVAGDYSATTGLSGGANGSGKWVNPNLNWSTDINANVMGMSLAVLGDGPSSGGSDRWLMGGTFSVPSLGLWMSTTYKPRGVIGGTLTTADEAQEDILPIREGLMQVERTSSTLLRLYENGASVASATTTILTSAASQSIGVLATGGGGREATGVRVGYAAIDDGTMGTNEVAMHSKRVANLQADLGRITRGTGNLKMAIIYGQSLSTADGGTTALSTTASNYLTKCFNGGVNPVGGNVGFLKPLVESGVETISYGFANTVANLYRTETANTDANDWLVCVRGVSATAYSGLAPGTTPYDNIKKAVYAAHRGAAWYRAGGSAIIPAVVWLHGESDVTNTSYDTNMVDFAVSINSDVQAITGQTEPVICFLSQMSSFTKFGVTTGPVNQEMLRAWLVNPARIVMLGAKYEYDYPDGIHPTNYSNKWMGEKFGLSVKRWTVDGSTNPVVPIPIFSSITQVGAAITIPFMGATGGLVLDTSLVTDPGTKKGFEYTDDSSPPAISTVAVDGTGTNVVVTLASTPTGGNKKIRYAYTGTAAANAGPTTGPRGCLRNTDPTSSQYGANMYRYAVHFGWNISSGALE